MSVEFSAPYPAIQTVSLFPNPSLSNSESLTDTMDVKHAMDGTLYTYVKTNPAKKMNWTFKMTRNKALELRAFVRSYLTSTIKVKDHEGRIWVGNIVNNPFEIRSQNRAGPATQGWPRGETWVGTIEFEGVEQASDFVPPTC
jgi:hypothetical protein